MSQRSNWFRFGQKSDLNGLPRAICIYCLLVNPVLWIANRLSCCIAGSYFSPGTLAASLEIPTEIILSFLDLVVVCFLGWGGWLLRTNGLGSSKVVFIGLMGSIIFSLVKMVIRTCISATASIHDQAPAAETSGIGWTVELLVAIASITAFMFEVVALIWIVRTQWQTPFGPNTGSS